MTIIPSVSGITQIFKLERMLMWSLHSFYSITNFCLIYSVSTLEFAKVALASITTLLLTTMYWKYKILYHVFQVIFAPLLVSANHTCKIDNKKFTADKIYYLNHTGRMRAMKTGAHQLHRSYLFSNPPKSFYLTNAWGPSSTCLQKTQG